MRGRSGDVARIATTLATIATIALTSAIAVALHPSVARADGVTVRTIADLHRACRESEEPGPRQLYIVTIPSRGWAFGAYLDADQFLPVDLRRNLRAFRGSAEIFPSRLESVGFVANARRVADLRRACHGGAQLRVGFLLAFDDQERRACLVRPAAGVTTVRADIAFVELIDARGRIVARDDTDRLRAWREEQEEDAVPGSGPRGAIGSATVAGAGTAVPAPWQEALTSAGRGAIGRAIATCHTAGVSRGADPDGQVVVHLRVDGRSGQVRASEVELSTIGDATDAACIARAFMSGVTFPPDSRGGLVELSVPVRLAADVGSAPPVRPRAQQPARPAPRRPAPRR